MSELDGRLDRLERTAAEQLHEIRPRDPMEAMRTLPEIVEAAGDVWKALPGEVHDVDAMDRLVQTSRAMNTALVRYARPYDPSGARDEGMLPLAQAIAGTEHLAASAADPRAARVQLMHIVHLSAHDARLRVAVELTSPSRNLNNRGYDKAAMRRHHGDLVGIDEIAGSYLRNSYPRQLDGPSREPRDHQDLGRALARWDVAAQRTVAGAHAPATLIQVAAGTTQVYQGVQGLLRAVERFGAADPGALLVDRIDHAGRAWADLGAFWQDLHSPRSSPGAAGSPLSQARREVHRAFGDLLLGPDGQLRPPQEVLGRLDVRETLESVHQALVSAAGHARALEDITRDPGQVLVRARSANQLLDRYTDRRTLPDFFVQGKGVSLRRRDDVAPVSPRDIALDRRIPMPQAVSLLVGRHIQEVTEAASGAYRASELPGARHRGPATAGGPAPSRRPEHERPSTAPPPAGRAPGR